MLKIIARCCIEKTGFWCETTIIIANVSTTVITIMIITSIDIVIVTIAFTIIHITVITKIVVAILIPVLIQHTCQLEDRSTHDMGHTRVNKASR